VATNDWDGQTLGVPFANNLGDESLGADDIEGSDTEQALRVEDSLGLEDLGGDGDGGVDGVGDDQDEGFGGNFGDDFDEALDNTSIDVEEVVAGHSWLAYSLPLALLHQLRNKRFRLTGNSGRNNDDIRVLESKFRSIILGKVAGDFLYPTSAFLVLILNGCTHGGRGDVGEIGSDTWGIDNIVQCQLSDQRRGLEEEG
jgi:hypothetical protein